MKKKVTHFKKIEYLAKDGYSFIRRNTYEYLKSREKISCAEATSNNLAQSDFSGERLVCADDEETRKILESYEQKYNGNNVFVYLKSQAKEFIEIPTDEYTRVVGVFSTAIMDYVFNNKGAIIENPPQVVPRHMVGGDSELKRNHINDYIGLKYNDMFDDFKIMYDKLSKAAEFDYKYKITSRGGWCD